ncbi:MAG: lysine--tRNA ligase [Spirochaetales bacterium]|jgi:lysyl-tRNA synthetase class 1|nr:lysine--tRNA ligase [Spirochaetales bacterium]
MSQYLNSGHWADQTAEKILREKGEKETYVCASGITPSGTVHIGNFREIISVDLVVRALRDRGKKVRFIYSWDDYDVFRKVPLNMPRQEELAACLRMPITLVPDPAGKEENYARANEKIIEDLLPRVGIAPEYIYQSGEYGASRYASQIRLALEKKEAIRRILDAHRTAPLEEDWWPVSVFCTRCHRDTTSVLGCEDWEIQYRCSSCGAEETLDLRKTGAVKLPWRVDWPMRWKEEGVDFEPAGKDHHSEGGSFDTAVQVVEEIFGGAAPVSFKYDFVRIKGGKGKMSSSLGEALGLDEALEVYQPEVTRYLFAGTRPNTEFAISLDLDVLKVYEDYDRCERLYWASGETEKEKKKKEKEARIYELSQTGEIPSRMPYQIPIRHLCNLLQIFAGHGDRVIAFLGDVEEDQIPRLKERCRCAWNWITRFAPEEFCFSLRSPAAGIPEMSPPQAKALFLLHQTVKDRMAALGEKDFSTCLYDIAAQAGLESTELFSTVYRALILKDKGPRLVSFLYVLGREKVLELLSPWAASGLKGRDFS